MKLDKHASASRSYRYLARQIENDLGETQKAHEVVVTGPGSIEFINQTILMFAYGLKNELGGKIIIIDATFRNQGVGDFLGYEGKPGLMNLLYEGNTKMGQMIKATRVDGIHVLPVGKLQEQTNISLKGEKVKAIFQKLGTVYDYIVIQVGPLQNDTRYISLAEYAELVLLLVEEGNTLLGEIESYRTTLENHNISNYQIVMSQKS